MAFLQTLGEQVFGWLLVAAYLLVPGAVATICWAPFLAFKRIQSLFRYLPLFESLLLTYVVVGIAASLPYVLGIVSVLVSVGADDIWGPPILGTTMALSICYVVAIPAIGVFGLPRAGIDWDPTGYGVSTWVVLTAGSVWYAVIFTVPLTILGLVLSLPGGY